MKTYAAGTVFAILLGLANLAHAGQLLSPPLTTHVRATNVTTVGACRVLNSGTKPLSLTVSLFSNNSVVPDFDTCKGAPLAAGHSCVVAVFLPDDSFAACKVTGDIANVRGTLELSESPTHAATTFLAVDLQ